MTNLRQPVVVARDTRGGWVAKVPGLDATFVQRGPTVSEAVSAARTAAGESGDELYVKVAEGTKLDSADVLDAIEANNGPVDLDLCSCEMERCDLGFEAIGTQAQAYRAQHRVDPPWLSEETGGVSLVFAVLSNANFFGANLNKAHLDGSDLRDAHIHEADLSGARFWWARLQGANLIDTRFGAADFRWADLRNVDLYNAGSLSDVAWAGSILGNTLMRREQLGAHAL